MKRTQRQEKSEPPEQGQPIERIALFDFCETLVKFQTADAFVGFVRENREPSLRTRFLETMRKLLFPGLRGALGVLLGMPPQKALQLQELKGMTQDELTGYAQRYYRERIRPNLVEEAVAELCRLREAGYRIYIVSGGYDIYIRCFAEEFGVHGIVASRLQWKKGVATGRLEGPDCMGKRKLWMLRQYFGKESLKDAASIAFSDSASDLPMLNYCREAVVVATCVPKWVKPGMGTILWERTDGHK